ncbi:MAG TPA: FdhF/YdeP family oxidoreductase [Thermoanaerobaculia bacterium]|nr:FdhF/YdeP family oxidoreductase [Thermoanaerobaculia bacterium]
MAFDRSRWASLSLAGLGKTKPHHFREMARIAWENRDEIPFAWRILRRGVCDGCSLGTTGMRDWTIRGTHLCMVRLELLRLNTMPALDPKRLADAGALASRSSQELRALGRLSHPMRRRRGEKGFSVISWSEAVGIAAGRLRAADPNRIAFYLTSRGIPNETYYVAQKAARLLGTNHVDNSARLCHAASTAAMKATLGYGASTGSYRDWIGSDLIVFFGSNVPNNQPVTTKYLYEAKKAGASIAVVNPYREPGLERYWVPSVFESALFGTKLTDHWFEVDTGGDLAFLNGVLKALLEEPGGIDAEFVQSRTSGFEEAAETVRGQSWESLEESSGATARAMREFARLLTARPRANFVWSMGLTQHTHGAGTIRALVNVGLARGLPGRAGCGLMPIRGHSGVQGGAEVGCIPNVDRPTQERWARVWGFDPPRFPGMATVEQIEAAADGRIDVFWILGGNFLETLPDQRRSRAALERPALRIHQDIVLTTAMLADPSDTVLVLPAATRYETPGGVTETSTERRIIFSPEIPGRRIPNARPEWEVLAEVVRSARPRQADRMAFASTSAIRQEIGRAIPLYGGIEALERAGDQMQWGGERLFEDGRFGTPDGRARFLPVGLPVRQRLAGTKFLSTRRGKQFNSMVLRQTDPLTGAARRDVLISDADARALGVSDGDELRLVSDTGQFLGRARLSPIKPGNLEVHWPEAMGLLSDALDPESLEPDYNTLVRVERVGPGP